MPIQNHKSSLHFWPTSETADDDESSEDEGRARGKKKSKTYEPSEEEVEQNEIIKNLNDQWKCEDQHCRNFVCFPDRTWSAAIQGKIVSEDGQAVDLQNPPDTKIFDHQDPDQEDLALVQSRTMKKTAANDSNITINLQLPDGPLPRQVLQNERLPLAPLQQPTRPRIAPQMDLETFCLRYSLGTNPFTISLQLMSTVNLAPNQGFRFLQAHLLSNELGSSRDFIYHYWKSPGNNSVSDFHLGMGSYNRFEQCCCSKCAERLVYHHV
ncbi:hypothetical protein DFH06DRAFT_1141163 [Mycena polygramma]|nr:hypothetical protein DFH06DRAFT_1141163 [Mycena polygramma]